MQFIVYINLYLTRFLSPLLSPSRSLFSSLFLSFPLSNPTKNGHINSGAVTQSCAGHCVAASRTGYRGQTDSSTRSSRHRVLSPPIHPLLFFCVDSEALHCAAKRECTKPHMRVILRNSPPHTPNCQACHHRQRKISGMLCATIFTGYSQILPFNQPPSDISQICAILNVKY